jgi:branched-subunit amino acid transport protein
MVDKVALGQDFVTVLQFTPVSIMLPLLHPHQLIDGQCSVTVKTGSIIK